MATKMHEGPVVHNYNLPHANCLRHHVEAYTSTSDDASSPTAISIANATFVFTISSAQGGTAKFTLGEVSDYTGNSGIIIDSAANGQYTIWVKTADWATLGGTDQPDGGWWYDVTATWTSGDSAMPNMVKTLRQGTMQVPDNATS